MCHRATLLLALLLMLGPGLCWAQEPGLESYDQAGSEAAEEETQAEEPAEQPTVSAPTCSGTGVVDLAGFVAAHLADTGRLPDLVQVQLTSGRLRILSAAEAFVLIARTVDLWRTNGELPETVPIIPADVLPPEMDPEDLPQEETDLTQGREIPTEPFLDQCQATVRWVDRLQQVPTAVWVGGHRLSAAEYLAGLVICVQYAYREGSLLDTIFLPAYAPPQTWAAGYTWAGAEEETSSEEYPDVGLGEEEAESEPGPEGLLPGTAPPVAPLRPAMAVPAPLPQARPELRLFPEPGAKVSGRVDLVASYSGPPASFLTFSVDEVTRAIMNIPPYGFRWETSKLAPGVHLVRVRVIGAGGVTLLDQVGSYTVVRPPEKPAAEQPADEF